MSKKAQIRALHTLLGAKERGELDPYIKKGIELLVEEKRPEVEAVLKSSSTATHDVPVEADRIEKTRNLTPGQKAELYSILKAFLLKNLNILEGLRVLVASSLLSKEPSFFQFLRPVLQTSLHILNGPRVLVLLKLKRL